MGLFDWTKRKSKENLDYGKKILGTEQIKETSSYIREAAKQVLSPKEQIKNAKKETFIEAKQRLRVSDADIVINYRNMVYGFYIALFFSLFCFGIVIYNLFVEMNLLGALSSIAILLVCLSNCFRFSFRAFQIKHQKLCSVNDWWNRATEWFPKLP